MMQAILEAWAQPMLEIIQLVAPLVEAGHDGMKSPEGAVVTTSGGDRIIELFKQKGYEPYEQIEGLWVIESLHFGEYGVTIDYRACSIHDHGTGVVRWFDDSGC
jgi:hypothetical protein